MATRSKADYWRIKKEGKCVSCWCDRGKDGTATLCRLCTKKTLKQQKKRKKELIREGKCVQCWRDRGKDGTGTMCRSCADKAIEYARRSRKRQRKRRKELIREGKCVGCWCNRGKDGTRTRCRSCADKILVSQRRNINRKKALSICIRCGRDRGGDGTTSYCRSCADKQNAGGRRRTERLKVLGLCIHCGQQKVVGGTYCEECRQRSLHLSLLTQAKRRAKKKGLPFDITRDDIEWVNICPVLGIPLVHNIGKFSDDSYSLDRMIPELGYVKGNVHVISLKANRIKNNATIEEVRKVVDWMEKLAR